ncbi:MAG: hypothetical protein U0984_08700 [Prosthecobacter sp.]|nr:hypothetical protein [Prosthecobacter sp.]
MNPEFTTLHDLLRRRLDVIADHGLRERDPTAQLDRLREVSEALAKEHERLRPILPARLNHFLTQSSLSKALEYLEMETV